MSNSPTAIECYPSGAFVDLEHPDPATIHVRDIAHHLALVNRYGGATSAPYSVARHSILVHDLLVHLDAPRDARVAGLWHDAAEAYVGDMVHPLKRAIRYPRDGARTRNGPRKASKYDVVSSRVDVAIVEAVGDRFGLTLDGLAHPLVRTADMWALRIEARELTATGGAEWTWPPDLPNDGELPGSVPWAPYTPWEDARVDWLEVARGYARAAS